MIQVFQRKHLPHESILTLNSELYNLALLVNLERVGPQLLRNCFLYS